MTVLAVAIILVRHALNTLRAPKYEARWAITSNFDRSERWQALILNTVVSTLLLWLWTYLNTADVSVQRGNVEALIAALVLDNPIWAGSIQTGFAIGSVFVLHHVGRAFGGGGDLDGAVAVMAWMTFVLNLVSLVQVVVWLVAPILAGLIGLFSGILIFVLLTCFCAELHGFRSLFMTFIGIVFTIFTILFGFSLLLALY